MSVIYYIITQKKGNSYGKMLIMAKSKKWVYLLHYYTSVFEKFRKSKICSTNKQKPEKRPPE